MMTASPFFLISWQRVVSTLSSPPGFQSEVDVIAHAARDPSILGDARDRGETHARRATDDVEDRRNRLHAADGGNVLLERLAHAHGVGFIWRFADPYVLTPYVGALALKSRKSATGAVLRNGLFPGDRGARATQALDGSDEGAARKPLKAGLRQSTSSTNAGSAAAQVRMISVRLSPSPTQQQGRRASNVARPSVADVAVYSISVASVGVERSGDPT